VNFSVATTGGRASAAPLDLPAATTGGRGLSQLVIMPSPAKY